MIYFLSFFSRALLHEIGSLVLAPSIACIRPRHAASVANKTRQANTGPVQSSPSLDLLFPLPLFPFFLKPPPARKNPRRHTKKIAGQRLQKDCSPPPQFRFSSAHVFSFGLAQPQQTEPNLDIVSPNRPYRSIATTLPSTALRSPGQLCCRAACRPAQRTRFSSAPFPCRCRLHSSDPTVSDPPPPRSAPLPPSPIP
ncbi:hypothetical protein CEP53_012685 [Fusarium sp. AF-6]|nr:hypothetical protein CEP53_012685 [Fusarium sp. AF-6]